MKHAVVIEAKAFAVLFLLLMMTRTSPEMFELRVKYSEIIRNSSCSVNIALQPV